MTKNWIALFPELRQAPHANSLLSQSMGLWFPNLRMLSGSGIGLPLALYICPYSRVTVTPYVTWTTFIFSRFLSFLKSVFIWKSLDSLGFQNLLCIANAWGCRQSCISETEKDTERDTKNLLRQNVFRLLFSSVLTKTIPNRPNKTSEEVDSIFIYQTNELFFSFFFFFPKMLLHKFIIQWIFLTSCSSVTRESLT